MLWTFRALLLVCALGLGPVTSAAGSSEDAGEFLRNLSEQAVAKLTDPQANETEKERRFRELFQAAFDVPTISKFVLGVHWRKASKQQRQAFIDAFEELNLRRFLPMFANFTDEKLIVTKVSRDSKRPDLFFVSSQVTRPGGGPPYVVQWRVRNRGDQFKILDIKVEEVSLALTLRKEYGAVVKSQGIDGLIRELKEKAK